MSDTTTSSARPDPEQLLRELDWLRRLARGLVHDPAAADDVAQRTALAALHRPPSGARKPWLARVARNFARQDHRSAGRRRLYEERAPAGTQPADPADLAAQAEIHRLLAKLVTALPDAQRNVIVLRYHHDLTPKEIAERLGIPAGTVRARLHRALARLRERLDERHQGDRRAWIAVLLPLADAGAAPATVRAPAARAPWIVAAACVVGVVVAVLFALDPAAPASGTPASAAPGDGIPSTTEVASVTPEVDTGPDDSRPVPSVRGTVLDGAGRPVEGARVALAPVLEASVPAPSGPAGLVDALERRASSLRSATTDADGAFSFDDVAPGTITVRARHLSGCSEPAEIASVSDDPVELRITHPAAITGEVLDPAGRPIADARVAFVFRQGDLRMPDVARTGADGRFVLAASSDPGQHRHRGLLADHDGFAPAVVSYVRSDRFVRVVLARGAILAGRVLDAGGVPVSNATVRATAVPRSDGQLRFAVDVARRTDAEGRFVLPRFGEDERDQVQVVATASGKGAVLHRTAFPRSTPLTLRLPATGRTVLVVRTSDGQPAPGVAIRVRGNVLVSGSWLTDSAAEESPFFDATVESSSDGELVIPGPIGTMFRLRCKSEDERYALARRSRLVSTQGGKRVELRLESRRPTAAQTAPDAPPLVVSGRVVDGTGAGLIGAQVTVWQESLDRPSDPAWTDASGRWETTVARGGTCFAQAYLPGYVGRSRQMQVSATERVFDRLELRRAVPITGRVTGRDDAPVARAYVGAHAEGHESVFTWTDAEGRFAFDGFPPDATVSVHRAPGHMPAYRKEAVGTSGQVQIRLEPASRISGRITTGDGRPVEACVLVAVSADGGSRRRRSVQSFTDGDGGFDISPLPHGTWDLYLMDGSNEVVRRGVESDTTGIAWVLPSRSPLAGRVVDPDGRPVAGTQVWVARDDAAAGTAGPSRGVAVTDARGGFRAEVEDLGTYAVWIDHPKLTTPVLRSISPGTEDLTLRLSSSAPFSGRLIHPDGGPAQGFVQLTPADGFGPARPRVIPDGETGVFQVPVPADVRYRVIVIASYADTALARGPLEYGTIGPGDEELAIELLRRE